MKVMTFNVLVYGPRKHTWKKRKELVKDTIRNYMPDTFGLQEAHYDWMKYIAREMPEYDYVGVGRDDGKKEGEFSPVFYRKDKYEVIESGNFWLSETPEKPSLGWDAACVRICSYALLKDKESRKEVAHFNTHLDHRGLKAMANGAGLIAKNATKFAGIPTIVTGDFNVNPDSEPYATIINGGFSDSRIVSESNDKTFTYHAFGNDEVSDIIDYIFVKDVKKVENYHVVTDLIKGEFPSDHYPVTAEIEL